MKLNKQIVDKFNQLYIMDRRKYLLMYVEGNEAKYSTNPYMLTDAIVAKHIDQKSTIGVFAGQYLTKFICFDVDTNSIDIATGIARRLIRKLVEDYKIPQEYIYLSFSGNKGWHIEIFFDKPLKNEHILQFYEDVCKRLGADSKGRFVDGSKVELRPTATMGVKLPLSKHYKTDAICYYADVSTFELIKDKNYILNIKQIETELFKKLVFEEAEQAKVFYLEPAEAEEVEELIYQTNIENKPLEQVRDDIEAVLEANRLVRDGTRNNMTFLIAVYLHNLGYSKIEIITRIEELLENTWKTARHLISESTTYEYMMFEISRIVDTVFRYNYILGMTRARIEITKGELLQILQLQSKKFKKTIYLKKLLFSMLIHSKKFARKNGQFYMAYSVMSKYGNAQDRGTLLEYLLELQEQELVEIVQRNQFSKALSKENGKVMSDTNIYRVTLKETGEIASITLRTDEEIDLLDIIPQMFSYKEIKKILPKSQIYNSGLKEAYTQKII